MTAQPATIIATVDDASGDRIADAVLTVRHIVRLTCGCHRYVCNRPGGGTVELTRGEHCSPSAHPPKAAPPESIPA